MSEPALADRLAALLGGRVTIADLRLVSGGNARRAWSFDAVSTDRTVQPCILLAQVAGKHVESDKFKELAALAHCPDEIKKEFMRMRRELDKG